MNVVVLETQEVEDKYADWKMSSVRLENKKDYAPTGQCKQPANSCHQINKSINQ